MCFEFLHKVEFVETPDVIYTVNIYRGVCDPSPESVDYQINTDVNTIMDNAIIAEVFKEVKKHGVESDLIGDNVDIHYLNDRVVVFAGTGMIEQFPRDKIHPETFYFSRHDLMRNRLILLALKDFSYVVQYSLVKTADADLPNNVIGQAELRMKFGLASESVSAYHRKSIGVEPTTPPTEVLSTFRKVWNHNPVVFPPFSDTRIMMMPVRIGWLDGIPEHYWRFMEQLFGMAEERFHGEIGYLTIDERELQPGETLRRPGLHVDGYYQGRCGAWGGGGGWGSVGNGMLTVSSTPHCKAYLGLAKGEIGSEGEAHQMDLSQCGSVVFDANEVYWVDGACIHESLPVKETTKRQFVRLSMPNNGPWFEGYTENPTGILPSHDILPRRDEFMPKSGE